ncbi:phosphatase PAP2 family protein [Furfurilactobacillus sp. WILCCON 0119]
MLLSGVLTDAHWLAEFDHQLTHLIRQPVTPERTWFFQSVTRLGNPHITLFVMLVFFAGLWWRKKRLGGAFFLVNVGVGALIINQIAKQLVERPRPTLFHLVSASGYSFPSGHAMNVTLMYGSLILLCNLYVDRLALRLVFDTLLILAIIGVCLSRIYLGVHYPSDVAAGVGLALCELFCVRYAFFKTTTVPAIKIW